MDTNGKKFKQEFGERLLDHSTAPLVTQGTEQRRFLNSH